MLLNRRLSKGARSRVLLHNDSPYGIIGPPLGRRARSQPQGRIVADEPIVSGMAGRYATALFELALEGKAIDAVKADLDKFEAMLAESADLVRLVRSPVFGADEQERALAAVLDKAKIGGLAAKFLRLVVQKRRLFAVREMARAFRILVAKHKGETRAEVVVAERLSDQRLEELKSAIVGIAGKKVMLDVKIDPSIIGGLKVQIGSRMIDASLKTKLNSIRIAMKEAR
jgi:F-type H+-transporting ATPase subunit delta